MAKLIGQLEVLSGYRSGTHSRFEEGQQRTVGRSPAVDVSIPEDSHLQLEHFAVELAAGRCGVVPTGGAAIWINGRPAKETGLRSGDMILAGTTMFSIRLTPVQAPKRHPALEMLDREENVYALIWVTADATIAPAIDASKARYAPISSDARNQHIWLISLQRQQGLRSFLLERGWGKRWGTYFVSPGSMEELQRHLTGFLRVPSRDGSFREFRVWDPGTLAEFLPRCNEAALRRFLGPASAVVFEGANPSVCIRYPLL